ncbi:MAG: hypothetical protein GY870_00755 [archaeon]|nr:hypothetical protein [archaeon]
MSINVKEKFKSFKSVLRFSSNENEDIKNNREIETLKNEIQDLRIQARLKTDYIEFRKMKVEIKKLINKLSELSGDSLQSLNFLEI